MFFYEQILQFCQYCRLFKFFVLVMFNKWGRNYTVSGIYCLRWLLFCVSSLVHNLKPWLQERQKLAFHIAGICDLAMIWSDLEPVCSQATSIILIIVSATCVTCIYSVSYYFCLEFPQKIAHLQQSQWAINHYLWSKGT